MSTSNRSAIISKSHRVLKKHYKPFASPADRPLLEHLLYACCLENSSFEAADEALAKMQQTFFDWNEIRVTTVRELSEVLSCLNDPADAATRLKKCLQSVFESHYSFDLDFLRKQNQGTAVKELEKKEGISRFAIAYVTQAGLAGHAIPTNRGALHVLVLLDVLNPAQAEKGKVPGLERAIPKSKGGEYFSLLHQLGVDFHTTPFSPRVRSILLEIDPTAKDRFPKRGKKAEQEGDTKDEKKSAPHKKAPPKRKDKPKEPAKGDKKSQVSTRKTSGKKSASKRLSKKKPR